VAAVVADGVLTAMKTDEAGEAAVTAAVTAVAVIAGGLAPGRDFSRSFDITVRDPWMTLDEQRAMETKEA